MSESPENPRHAPPREAKTWRWRWLWVAALPVAAVFLLRAFVVDVYLVDSVSMEPTIHGSPTDGDRVLVRYGSPEPKRFDLVVIQLEGSREPVVKRVAGLPGESVLVSGGDLVIDGERLPPDAPRPAPVLVFDRDLQPVEEHFRVAGPMRNADGELVLPARGPEPGGGRTTLCYLNAVNDDWVRPDGTLHSGTRPVGDLVIETEVRIDELGGRAFWRLTEGGDFFEVALEPTEGDGARLWIVRRTRAPGAAGFLLAAEIPFRLGEWRLVRFANVDNVVSFWIEGADEPWLAPYDVNAPRAGEGRHMTPRACFGADGCELRVRAVRLLRDLHYTQRGDWGVRGPLTLGPDEIFVLGDNSAHSTDSREWGPVPLDRVLGVPIGVVWPWERRRGLRGAEGPPARGRVSGAPGP